MRNLTIETNTPTQLKADWGLELSCQWHYVSYCKSQKPPRLLFRALILVLSP